MRRKIGRFAVNHPPSLEVLAPSLLGPSWEWSAQVPETIRAEHVRSACLAYLRLHATPASDIAGAELILGELVANVERHAQGSASFHLDWRGRYPWLLVLDGGSGFQRSPTTTLAEPLAESGRGLALVQSLAIEMELGNRPDGGGYVLVTLPVQRAQRT